MPIRPLIFALCAAAGLIAPSSGADRTIVLELFTSQGCSSCPPADALLQAIAKEPGIIALSRPITYWDKLGWTDTLARPENTQKQKEYAWAMGRQGVYTPQLVADGRFEGNGADGSVVRALVAQARENAQGAEIAVSPLAGDRWRIAVTGGDGAAVTLVSFFPYQRVAIAAGENDGREIVYTNAVRSEALLGTVANGAASFETQSLAVPSAEGPVGWAVIVQDGKAGPIKGSMLVRTQ